jgi:hypothetical protein
MLAVHGMHARMSEAPNAPQTCCFLLRARARDSVAHRVTVPSSIMSVVPVLVTSGQLCMVRGAHNCNHRARSC